MSSFFRRILCLDYGEKRIGLAISDALRLTAQPLDFLILSSKKQLMQEIRKKIEEFDIETIVIGLPKNMDGSLGTKAEEVKQLSRTIGEELKIEVALWDERLTTREAEKILINEFNMSREKRKKVIDSLAACIILQSYLDAHSQSTLQRNSPLGQD